MFKLTPKGVETVLYNFPSPPTVGGFPRLPLTQGPDSVLYGMATNCAGGGCAQAALFDITTKGLFSVVSVLSSLYPVLVAILARVFLHERLTMVQRGGALVAIGGAAAISAG